MNKKQRSIIEELGPYILRKDGVVIDANGFALFSTRPSQASVETEWDVAAVAALNDICKQRRKARKGGP